MIAQTNVRWVGLGRGKAGKELDRKNGVGGEDRGWFSALLAHEGEPDGRVGQGNGAAEGTRNGVGGVCEREAERAPINEINLRYILQCGNGRNVTDATIASQIDR